MPEPDNTEQPGEPVKEPGAAAPETVQVEPGADADPQTDEAVSEIVKNEGDEALKTQDEIAAKAVVMKQSPWERFRNFVAATWANPRKRYGILGVFLIVIIVILAVPFTRYNVLGLVLKAPVTVQVVDSKTGQPVSGATVTVAGKTALTEANGKAALKVKAGSKQLQVSKKYYQGYTHGELVTLSAQKNTYKTKVVALGRQVKIRVINKVSGKPVSGAVVNAGGSNAKSDAAGTATLVIASDAATQTANVTLAGYNTAKVNISPSGTLAQNTFSITPAGKLYFLSNLSGKLDVVKTNLDGTDRQTVLAGTGSEDQNSTSLLASRDWKYLALLSKRSGTAASVYLIDTTNGDKLTTVDQGNANFNFVGWNGDKFIYQVDRSPTVSAWQPNQQALKSLDATTGQTLLLDQTQASGTNQYDFVGQSFGSPYIIGNQVVYAKNWNCSYTNPSALSGKQAELDSIGADGSNHKVIKTFSLDAGTQASSVNIATQLYEPNGLYIYFASGSKDNFYDYDDGTVTADTTLTANTFYSNPYPTYLLSPSGSSTFWSEQRDGKNTLFTGDQDAKNSKQIASLSPYNTYGWYTDDYLLVSKGSSELYIMPTAGGAAFKISDYYKPAINYQGYGGGYGGL